MGLGLGLDLSVLFPVELSKLQLKSGIPDTKKPGWLASTPVEDMLRSRAMILIVELSAAVTLALSICTPVVLSRLSMSALARHAVVPCAPVTVAPQFGLLSVPSPVPPLMTSCDFRGSKRQ